MNRTRQRHILHVEPIGFRRDGRPIWPIRGAAEQVFNIAQLGRQAGTFYNVGAPCPARSCTRSASRS